MVVKVLSFWEQGWNTPIKEYDLWHFPVREFQIDEFIMIPISGIDGEVTEYKDFEDVNTSDVTIVWIDENGEDDLQDFEHPENAMYVFGRTSLAPMNIYKKDGDKSVKITTLENKGLLWGHQAMVLVLYDRMLKNGSNSN